METERHGFQQGAWASRSQAWVPGTSPKVRNAKWHLELGTLLLRLATDCSGRSALSISSLSAGYDGPPTQ
jgi:hypothetical protein